MHVTTLLQLTTLCVAVMGIFISEETLYKPLPRAIYGTSLNISALAWQAWSLVDVLQQGTGAVRDYDIWCRIVFLAPLTILLAWGFQAGARNDAKYRQPQISS